MLDLCEFPRRPRRKRHCSTTCASAEALQAAQWSSWKTRSATWSAPWSWWDGMLKEREAAAPRAANGN